MNITDLCVLHEWYSISHHGIGFVIQFVLRPYKRSDTFFIARRADRFRTIALRMILFFEFGNSRFILALAGRRRGFRIARGASFDILAGRYPDRLLCICVCCRVAAERC